MRKRPQKKTSPQRLIIDRIGRTGLGMAGDVAVPFTHAGDDVLLRDGKSPGLSFESKSAAHVEPVCSHFGWEGDGCGGCLMQHLGTSQSLRWKRDHVVSAIGKVMDVPDTVQMIQVPERDRRRARLAFRRAAGQGWTFGFRAYRQHRVVSMTQCHILHPALFEAAMALAELAERVFSREASLDAHFTLCDNGLDIDITGIDEFELDLAQRELLARFVSSERAVRLSIEGQPLSMREVPMVEFGGQSVPVPPGVFLQASKAGEAALQNAVCHPLVGTKKVADLFCGIGTFAVPLSAHAEVWAIDGDKKATAALSKACSRIQVACRDLFRRPLMASELSGLDAVVLDPPRAGAKAQVSELEKAGVPRIVMVSCNPDTLVRDLGQLRQRYSLSELTIVDQFLWSPHTEVVAVLDEI